MSTPSYKREMLSSIKTIEDFFSLCQALRKIDSKEQFDFLFPIAISPSGDRANVIAAFALIELEPKCPITCEEIIEVISNSRWNVSIREVPFYLVS